MTPVNQKHYRNETFFQSIVWKSRSPLTNNLQHFHQGTFLWVVDPRGSTLPRLPPVAVAGSPLAVSAAAVEAATRSWGRAPPLQDWDVNQRPLLEDLLTRQEWTTRIIWMHHHQPLVQVWCTHESRYGYESEPWVLYQYIWQPQSPMIRRHPSKTAKSAWRDSCSRQGYNFRKWWGGRTQKAFKPSKSWMHLWNEQP